MSRFISEPGSIPAVVTGGEPRAPFFNRCIYDSPGTYCFTVPSGVCTIRVVTVGAGGPSCRRVGPDEEYLPSLTSAAVAEKLACGHDGFHHKMITCIRPISSCADYCNCSCCGSFVQSCCSKTFGACAACCLYFHSNFITCLGFTNGVAGAGTTLFLESCYMSGQSIVAPSGGYADGCLSVTSGCSYTVTVASSGGTSGFGTFISATGGSVAITQRPKVLCHFLNNACYIFCGLSGAGATVSSASTTSENCTVFLSNSTHCFIHRYQNCCALATLTAGVGTAWSGMSNIIVRSGAAGTIFHPTEYSFAGCITGPSGITGRTDPFCSCLCLNSGIFLGFTSTTNDYCICCSCGSGRFGYGGIGDVTCFNPAITCTSEHKFIKRSWGGASAGSYFGNGINQSDYDIVCFCSTPSTTASLVSHTTSTSSIGQHSYYAGPLLPCCAAIQSCLRLCACSCLGTHLFCFNVARGVTITSYGAAGGSGIKSPGTVTLAGSGSACCVCALSCGVGSAALCYRPTDNVNGIFDVICSYPPTCCCGVVCCTIVPNNIVGSSYWYPEDMNGHSNAAYCIAPINIALCAQPGSGGSNVCATGYRPGVLGGSSSAYCPGSSITLQSTIVPTSTCPLCGGGSSGFDTNCIYSGACLGNVDCRCQNFSTGLVIVYY